MHAAHSRFPPLFPSWAPHPHPFLFSSQLITCLHVHDWSSTNKRIMVSTPLSEHARTHTHRHWYIHLHRVHAQITLSRGEPERHRNLFESGDDFKRRRTAVNLKANITSHLLSAHSLLYLSFSSSSPLCATYSIHSCRGALTAPLENAVEENACAARVVWPLVFSIWSQHSKLACCLSVWADQSAEV